MQSFRFERASPDRLCDIVDLVNMVFMPNHLPARGMQEIFPLFLSKDNACNLFISIVDDAVVSHIGIYPGTIRIGEENFNVASMGAVCTHPDFRGKGIATNLFGYVEQSLKEEGFDLLLVSGGRGLYRRNGCVDLTGFVGAVFSRNNERSHRRESGKDFEFFELPGECHNLDQVLDAYQREHVRFERTLDTFRTTLNSLSLDPNSLVVLGEALDSEKVVGYVIVRISMKDGAKVGEMREYAGDRRAVVDGLYKLIYDYDLRSIDLCIPGWDRELIGLLREYGIETFERSLPGYTGKIITFSRGVERLMSQYGEANDCGLSIPMPLPGVNYV